MIDVIYVERELAGHPRVRAILDRYPTATRIPCDRYTEVFNPKSQNFRLQKTRPALILARKHEGFVLDAPASYAIGSQRNHYFSHMLNCVYDCRYCFLQGMYRSAHYVLFVNYEDFGSAIDAALEGAGPEAAWFFSGYDCDSLALEPVTGFAAHFLPFFAKRPHAWLELRTKSTQIRGLLGRAPLPNCVVAFSLSPQRLAQALEHRAPDTIRRLDAMARLAKKGWRLGLRFDPLLYQDGYQEHYRELFEQVFQRLSYQHLHSVSLGSFRLPRNFFRTMQRLYPDEMLFAGPLEETDGMVSYRKDLEQQMLDFCANKLLEYIPREIFFPCHGDATDEPR